MKLKLGELFAGYGGLGLAVEEVFGAETAWFSEFEAAPSRILAHRWPGVPNYGDVTKIDWASVEPVDIFSGGSPCQDLSLAGKRRGMTNGTRSNLWESMREGIATIKPKYVVWENVRGAYSAGAYSEMELEEGRMGADGDPHLRALGRVLGDLSDLGYDCQWRGLRAADVGAPHGRFRVFILATYRDYLGINRARQRAQEGRRGQPANRRLPAPNSESKRRNDGHANHLGPAGGTGNLLVNAGDASTRAPRTPQDWGEYEPAIQRWESVLGRCSPAPTEPTGRDGGHRLSARFAEWMMGMPKGWIVDVPGISRADALKAAGNGVVPQQAAAALRDMLAAATSEEVAA
ncbi:DNA cytosine methyltransferase [Arthrobacter sp. MDT1-65]